MNTINKTTEKQDVMKRDQIEKHSTTQSVILHLLPGILAGCLYLLARQPVANMGYPSIVALILAYAFILIPVELGYLFYQGKKRTGRFTLQGIISYRNPIPWWQYLRVSGRRSCCTGYIRVLSR